MAGLVWWAPFVVAGIAVVTDWRWRRIPNVLTVGAACAAVTWHLATGGFGQAAMALGGGAVALALFFPLFALGGLGAGDVKLLAALGLWLGPADTLWLAALTAIVGGVMAVAAAIRAQYLRQALRNLWLLLTFWRTAGVQPLPTLTLDTSRGPRVAYAVPILAGLVLTAWLR